jgi:hypothetical protein
MVLRLIYYLIEFGQYYCAEPDDGSVGGGKNASLHSVGYSAAVKVRLEASTLIFVPTCLSSGHQEPNGMCTR